MNDDDAREQLQLLRKLANRRFVAGYSFDPGPQLPLGEKWMMFLAFLLGLFAVYLFFS